MALLKRKKIKQRENEIPEPPDYPYEFPETTEMRDAIKKIKNKDRLLDESVTGMPELPEMSDIENSEINYPQPSFRGIKGTVKTKPKRLVKEIGESPKERISRKGKALFIKIDKFNEILDSIDNIEKRVKEMDNLVKKLQDIKGREEQEIVKWKEEVDEIKDDISTIEKSLSDKA